MFNVSVPQEPYQSQDVIDYCVGMSINTPDGAVAIDTDWWEQRKAGYKRIIQTH